MEILTTTTKRMLSYQEMVRSWQRDHSDAKEADAFTVLMQKYDFSGLLCEGMLLWKSITELHQGFLDSVSSGEIEPNLPFEEEIWDLYQAWLQHTQKLESVLLCFKERGIDIEHAAEFSECLSDAQEQLSNISRPDVAIVSFAGFPAQPCP